MKADRDRVEKVVLRTSEIWTIRDPVTICMLRVRTEGRSVGCHSNASQGERELTIRKRQYIQKDLGKRRKRIV